MVISARRLSEGEVVVASTRTHGKALVVPSVVLIATCAVTGFVSAWAVNRVGAWLAELALAAAVLVICAFTVRPFLRWLSTTYTVTNRRILVRSGIVRRVGSEVPLLGVTDVSFTRGFVDRLLGSGTLIVSDATEFGGTVLADVPRVRTLQLTIADAMHDVRRGAVQPAAVRRV
jgi:uncharacterized membrane protein YdbT with pleckstrin-like domain